MKRKGYVDPLCVLKSQVGMNRRAFLRYGLEAGLVAGVVYAVGVGSVRASHIRPPGSLAEEAFRSHCIRCGACVVECPGHALRQLDVSLDFSAIGTPVLYAKRGGCEAWLNGCSRCVTICPTGALRPFDREKTRLAKVVMKPVERCDNCMICFQRCPIPGAVLFPNPAGLPFTREQDIPTQLKLRNVPQKPYFDTARCVGCGQCAAHCPPRILYLEPIAS